MPTKANILLIFVLLTSLALRAQTAWVEGNVTDSTNRPVDLANVAILGEKKGTTTDKKGWFRIEVPANKEVTLAVSFIGYADKHIPVKLEEGEIDHTYRYN